VAPALLAACGSSGGGAAKSSAVPRGTATAAFNLGQTQGTMNWQKLVPTPPPATAVALTAAVTKSCGGAYAAAPHPPADRSDWVKGCVTGAITTFTKATH
jgi:hypothetical protein